MSMVISLRPTPINGILSWRNNLISSLRYSDMRWWIVLCVSYMGLPGDSESACNEGDLGLVPRSGRSSGDREWSVLYIHTHTHTPTHSLSVPKPMPIFAPTYGVWLYPALLSVQWVKNGIFVVFDWTFGYNCGLLNPSLPPNCPWPDPHVLAPLSPLPYLVTETSQIGFSEQLWDEVMLDYLVDLMSFKYPWKKEAGGSKSEKENVRMEADFSEEMSVQLLTLKVEEQVQDPGKGVVFRSWWTVEPPGGGQSSGPALDFWPPELTCNIKNDAGELSWVLCGDLEGWEVGEPQEGGIYVYLWLNHMLYSRHNTIVSINYTPIIK